MNSEKFPIKEYEFCKRCGRKLKKPEARQLGYGAVCYKKMQSGGRKLFADVLDKRPTSTNTVR